jgi:hypothetical protein
MILKAAGYLLMALLPCDPAPRLATLFTPLHPVLGQYELCTTPAPLSAVAPGDVRVEVLDPLDAFGTAGGYDRSAVARVYGGKRAQVVRKWVQQGNEFESQTFISPYPDPTLTHLVYGTLTIRFILRGVPPSREPASER